MIQENTSLPRCSSSNVMDSISFTKNWSSWFGFSYWAYCQMGWVIPMMFHPFSSYCFFPLHNDLHICTHLSSGSSFSSLEGVTLIPPFLARGQPDKLQGHRTKSASLGCCLPITPSAAVSIQGTVLTFCVMHSSQSRGQNHHNQVSGTYRIIYLHDFEDSSK